MLHRKPKCAPDTTCYLLAKTILYQISPIIASATSRVANIERPTLVKNTGGSRMAIATAIIRQQVVAKPEADRNLILDAIGRRDQLS